MRRREFIGLGVGGVAAVSLGAAFWDELFGSAQSRPLRRGARYGPRRPPDENGVRLPEGFASRLVARGGELVAGSGYRWHLASDGMASFPERDGGFVLASNSEALDGGASALRFGPGGELRGAYSILSGTTQNCSGGGTPWGTWLSCEEVESGRVWECDPAGRERARPHPAMGVFKHEAAAVRRARTLRLPVRGSDRRRALPLHARALARARLRSARDRAGGRGRAGRLDRAARPRGAPRAAPAASWAASSSFARGEGLWLDGDTLYLATTGDDRVHAYDARRGRMRVVYDGLASARAPLLRVDQLTGSRAGEVFVCEDIATERDRHRRDRARPHACRGSCPSPARSTAARSSPASPSTRPARGCTSPRSAPSHAATASPGRARSTRSRGPFRGAAA